MPAQAFVVFCIDMRASASGRCALNVCTMLPPIPKQSKNLILAEVVFTTVVPDSVLCCVQASAGSGSSPRPSAGKGRSAAPNIERRNSAEDVVAAYQARNCAQDPRTLSQTCCSAVVLHTPHALCQHGETQNAAGTDVSLCEARRIMLR